MGKLIVMEGLDGSGKSTQISLFCQRLERENKIFRRIKLPDYDDPSSTLVKMYLGGEFGDSAESVNAFAASAFFAVDRYASFKRHWGEDYEAGKLIVSDRYTTSNACHQLEKLPEERWDGFLDWLEDFEYKRLGIPRPDSVIYLDMPVEISQRLLSERYSLSGGEKDVHEADSQYLVRCRRAALYACEKWGWLRIDCSRGGEPRSKEEIAEEIYSAVMTEGK